MNGKWKLEKPQSVLDAAKVQGGLHIVLELLVFVAVFMVSAIGEMIIMFPGMIVLMVANDEFRKMLMSETVDTLVLTEQMLSDDAMTILMLFSTLAMILITMLFCKLLQKRKMNTLGFRKKGLIVEYIRGIIVGFVLFSAAVLICVFTGSLEMKGLSGTFAVGTFLCFTVGYMIQGMSEEVLCRGYFLVSVGRRYSMLVAIIANSVLFAALHLANDGLSVLALVNLTLFGVFASVYYIKTDNIWGVGAIHSVWNLVQGNVYGIRVSGMVTSCSVLESEVVVGKELINGGAFGLEGGLAVTVVLVVGTVIMLCMKTKEAEVIHE